MQFGFEKYCCFIPHRMDTFFVAIWFSMAISFHFVSFLVSPFALEQVKGFALKMTAYSGLFICFGGLCGFISSLFGSRKLTKVFSIVLWISCVASIIIYIMTLSSFFNSEKIEKMLMGAYDVFTTNMEKGKRDSVQRIMNDENIPDSDKEEKISAIESSKPFDFDNEYMEGFIKDITNYFFIIYAIVAFVFQLYQLYFANIVHAYSKKILYFAQYHKLYAQKQEMLEKEQEGKFE